MRIEKLVVKNFRSFDEDGIDVTFPKTSRPFAVVGHNNSGKSNFINAILYGLCNKTTFSSSFEINDFYNKESERQISIDVYFEPSISKIDAYGKFSEICSFQLRVSEKEGIIDSNHYAYDGNCSVVRTTKTIGKVSNAKYSEDQKEIIRSSHKIAVETAYNNRNDIPIFYIDAAEIKNQLKANRSTLLGKMLADVRRDFDAKTTTIPQRDGVVAKHVGRQNAEVLNVLLDYIERHVITTPKLESITNEIKDSIKRDLNLDDDNFELGFGFPSVEEFYKNLEFFIQESVDKPKLPISRFGSGFISLFVIAMLKVLIKTDEGGKMIIIEEPETFLHEHFQEYFHKLLEQLAKNNQVIYTTHSKKFVNIFEPQTIIKMCTPTFKSSKVIHHPAETIQIPEHLEGYKIRDVDDFAMYLRTLEPNIGNVIFASKVLIVEGPHDVLAYKTALSTRYNLELENVSIVAAWGKDAIKSLIQVCQLFRIEYFVIHDFDLDSICDITLEQSAPGSAYSTLTADEKAQYTRNHEISKLAGSDRVHHNVRNLEAVLRIEKKGSIPVYEKVSGKTLKDVQKEFPAFLPQSLLDFLDSK